MTIAYLIGAAVAYLTVGHLFMRWRLPAFMNSRWLSQMKVRATFKVSFRERRAEAYQRWGVAYITVGSLFWPLVLLRWVLAGAFKSLSGALDGMVRKVNPIAIENARQDALYRKARAERDLLEDEYATGLKPRPDRDCDFHIWHDTDVEVSGCRKCQQRFIGEFHAEDARMHFRTTHDGWVVRQSPTKH